MASFSKENDVGVYIEGLDRPRNEYMRIHIDFDGEVWVFRESGWKSLGINATDLDLVRCGECKWLGVDDGMPFCYWWLREIEPDVFCSYGERKE